MNQASIFAALFVALYVAHQVMDHWGQTNHQASNKGRHGSRDENRAGAAACLGHVTTYTVGAVMASLVVILSFGLHVTAAAFLAGHAVSAVTHYWADRRFTLAGLANRWGRRNEQGVTGKTGFYRMGSPRPDHDDNLTLGTGSYALDQSWHYLWLGVAAFIMAAA